MSKPSSDHAERRGWLTYLKLIPETSPTTIV